LVGVVIRCLASQRLDQAAHHGDPASLQPYQRVLHGVALLQCGLAQPLVVFQVGPVLIQVHFITPLKYHAAQPIPLPKPIAAPSTTHFTGRSATRLPRGRRAGLG
jgi:hypothetical protein